MEFVGAVVVQLYLFVEESYRQRCRAPADESRIGVREKTDVSLEVL